MFYKTIKDLNSKKFRYQTSVALVWFCLIPVTPY